MCCCTSKALLGKCPFFGKTQCTEQWIFRRAKAVKELLTRCAAQLDDWVTRGLVGSLKLPMAWINEAKVRFTTRLRKFRPSLLTQ